MADAAGTAAESAAPALHHTLSLDSTSVLSLAVDQERGLLFAGTQSGSIVVCDLHTQQKRALLLGHTRSVLALALAHADGWLFSSSSDRTVRVWDAHVLRPVALIHPASENVGDILSLAWCAPLRTLYLGCQNTTIQWVRLTPDVWSSGPGAASVVRGAPPHKFFDTGSADRTRSASWAAAHHWALDAPASAVRKEEFEAVPELAVDRACVVPTAHYGYVYSLHMLTDTAPTLVLASGSGDEAVHLWALHEDGRPVLASTLTSPAGAGDAVLALASWQRTLFAGKQGGAIEVWDVDSQSLIRTLSAHADDVLTLEAVHGSASDVGRPAELFSAGADGAVCRWDRYFRREEHWVAHGAIVQCCALYLAAHATEHERRYSTRAGVPLLLTGSSDATVRCWVTALKAPVPGGATEGPSASTPGVPGYPLLSHLAQFVQYKSISPGRTTAAGSAHMEDCRQAAHFLKRTLQELGASELQLLPDESGGSPLVLGTFAAAQRPARRRCLFYGHYDCMPATGAWSSEPFTLTGRDGYLYARGVSDNKGPVLAVAYAASELLRARTLDVDMVLLVEGEQEIGSKGFPQTLHRHKHALGAIDVVLLCNSYWLGEERPCLTVGLRGVVHAAVSITARRADVHSGVEGGADREPMMDMVKLLATLTGDVQNRITLPGFYERVRPVGEDERRYYESLARLPGTPAAGAERLMARWRMPSLTVHKVTHSAPGDATLIPHRVEASLSVRIVPDQALEEVERQLREGIEQSFAALGSSSEVRVDIYHRADWWRASLESPYWHALAHAVEAEWGITPMLILEGGVRTARPHRLLTAVYPRDRRAGEGARHQGSAPADGPVVGPCASTERAHPSDQPRGASPTWRPC